MIIKKVVFKIVCLICVFLTNISCDEKLKKVIDYHPNGNAHREYFIDENGLMQLRRTGSTPLQGNFEAQKVPADNKQQRIYTAQLNTFYDEVIDCISDAESILIMGPGVAKDELKARLEEKKLGDRISSIDTADNMTNPQVTAKVRQHFGG